MQTLISFHCFSEGGDVYYYTPCVNKCKSHQRSVMYGAWINHVFPNDERLDEWWTTQSREQLDRWNPIMS